MSTITSKVSSAIAVVLGLADKYVANLFIAGTKLTPSQSAVQGEIAGSPIGKIANLHGTAKPTPTNITTKYADDLRYVGSEKFGLSDGADLQVWFDSKSTDDQGKIIEALKAQLGADTTAQETSVKNPSITADQAGNSTIDDRRLIDVAWATRNAFLPTANALVGYSIWNSMPDREIGIAVLTALRGSMVAESDGSSPRTIDPSIDPSTVYDRLAAHAKEGLALATLLYGTKAPDSKKGKTSTSSKPQARNLDTIGKNPVSTKPTMISSEHRAIVDPTEKLLENKRLQEAANKARAEREKADLDAKAKSKSSELITAKDNKPTPRPNVKK